MINKLADIVRQASEIMMKRDFGIEQKGNDSNYVTSCDIAVQEYLTEKLTLLIPGSTVLGEEGERRDIDRKSLWIIDPIDGTSNFIRDMGLSVISVAYMKDGKLDMACVYQPDRDEMFTAEAGKGAFLNGKQIHVSERDYAHSHLCSAMSLYKKDYAKPCFNIIEKIYMETDDLRRLGTAALELAYLAAGRVELYFEIRINAWDVAAAVLLIQEAGGFVAYPLDDEMPLDKPFPICAANSKSSLEKISAIIAEEIPDSVE